MIVLGFSGRAGSGKDTSCELLKKLRPDLSIERYAFVDLVKSTARLMLAHLYGIVLLDEDFHRPEKKNMEIMPGLTVRKLLQGLGTRLKDVFGENVWIEACLNQARNSSADVVIFTDVRFLNEAQAIREWAREGNNLCKIVRIQRDVTQMDHVSETELESIVPDEVIINDGNMKGLEERLKNIIG